MDDLARRELLEAESARLETRFAQVTSPLPQTGLQDLDHLLGGLRPGLTVAVSGRPGIGKSALLFTIAIHTGGSGHRTTLVSRDLPLADVADRLTALASGVPVRAIRSGALASRAWDAISAARLRPISLRVASQSGDEDLALAAGERPVDDVVLIDGGSADLITQARSLRDRGSSDAPAVVIALTSDPTTSEQHPDNLLPQTGRSASAALTRSPEFPSSSWPSPATGSVPRAPARPSFIQPRSG